VKDTIIGASVGIGITVLLFTLAFAGVIDDELHTFASWVESYVNAGG
jgi:hypothetical protein